METIYENLKTIQRANPKIEVSREDDRCIIYCKADGKKKIRIFLLVPLVLFAISLIGAIFSPADNKTSPISGLAFILACFGGLVYMYTKYRFRNEKMIILENELQKITHKNVLQVVSRESIIGIDYMSNKDAIVALTNTGPVLFFRNSDPQVLQKISYVLKEIWFKKSQQL